LEFWLKKHKIFEVQEKEKKMREKRTKWYEVETIFELYCILRFFLGSLVHFRIDCLIFK
jgi:hypothetical protein